MTLRQEVEQMLVDMTRQNQTWSNLESYDPGDPSAGIIATNLQEGFAALNSYCDTLLRMTLHIADAVDDLRDRPPVEDEG